MLSTIVLRAATILSGLALFLALSPSAQAQYRVTQDVSALSGLGTFSFEFQLSDGSQIGNGTGQVDIFNVSLIGTALTDPGSALGNATGDLASVIRLRDTDASWNGLADFSQGFSVSGGIGSRLVFDLDLRAFAVDTPLNDGFFFTILDGNGVPLATEGPTQSEFIATDFSSSTTDDSDGIPIASFVPRTYGSAANSSPSLPAPGVASRPAPPVTAAPEPSSLALIILGIGGYLVRRRK